MKLLNSAVFTNPGTFQYREVTFEEAYHLLQAHEIESFVGYEQTAFLLTSLLGKVIGVNRGKAHMEVGDTAVVCRLKVRVPPEDKGGFQLNPQDVEMGTITRLE